MNRARVLLVLALGGALTPVMASGAESDAMRSAFLRQWAPRLTEPGADSTGFWQTVAARGTPIVERVEGDARFVHVTFLYRGRYALGDPRGPRPGASDAFDGLSEDDFPQQEWLARQIATSPVRPIRLHLEVGTLEHVDWENPYPRYATPSVLLANRHLRDVLDAKGYAFSYREYNGPHDSLVWRGTVGDAIVELLGASRR